MATTKSKGSMNDDDVHITYEDQSKINRFAINNTKLHEYQDELVARNKELENLNEAIVASQQQQINILQSQMDCLLAKLNITQ